MKRIKIVDVFAQPEIGKELIVKGWVRGFRSNRFIQVNDGSTIKTLQAVVEFENFDEAILKKITTGSAVGLKGILVESQGAGQAVELQVSEIEIIGEANPDDRAKRGGFFDRFQVMQEHVQNQSFTFDSEKKKGGSLPPIQMNVFQYNF